jgi:hypothetical protein
MPCQGISFFIRIGRGTAVKPMKTHKLYKLCLHFLIMEINTDSEDLENALSSDIPTISEPVEQQEGVKPPEQPSDSVQPQQAPQLSVSKDEEIGVHKGALNTLIAERNELIKMISNVEVIMQAHIARLKELGVEIKMKEPEQKQ